MRLPERIAIRVLADGSPTPQMFVKVTIKTSRKNNFGSAYGPTDHDGALCCRVELANAGAPVMGEKAVIVREPWATKLPSSPYVPTQVVRPWPGGYVVQPGVFTPDGSTHS